MRFWRQSVGAVALCGVLLGAGSQTALAVGGQAGGMQDLGVLSGDVESEAIAVDQGVVVGWSGNGMYRRAFKWTAAGGMTALPSLAGNFSEAQVVENSVVAGWSRDQQEQLHVTRWAPDGTPEDLSGGLLLEAQTVKVVAMTNGEITGYADLPTGGTKAFYWSSATGFKAASSVGLTPTALSPGRVSGTAFGQGGGGGRALRLEDQWGVHGHHDISVRRKQRRP